MNYYLWCALALVCAYGVNITYLSVFYHRGLTHGAVKLRPWVRKFIVLSGPWITGLDPKVWCCMHREHHRHSDTPRDPHSPVNLGVLGVFMAQKNAYSDTTGALIRGEEPISSTVTDLDFPVHWLSRNNLYLLPYVLHGIFAVGLALTIGWLFAACYFVGLLSHPLQGWMVNSLGHYYGYRNFNLDDNSRNNTMVAWLVLGEGFQNNHHQDPKSAKFSARWWELDAGYLIVKLARAARLLDITPPTVSSPSG